MEKLTNRLASLALPNWRSANTFQDAILLPAACGPKLFFRLVETSPKSHDGPVSDVETLALSCLRDFRRAIGLRLSAPGIVDIRKVASCFETNAYRVKAVTLRTNLVYVDQISGVTSYVPPPSIHVPSLIKDLYGIISKRLNGDAAVLASAFYGMCHFIAIHPLDDGNGRLGRALFMRLCARGGISPQVSGALIAVLHIKHANLFYPGLMKYCLSGNIHALADLLALSVSEISNSSQALEYTSDMGQEHRETSNFLYSMNIPAWH